MAPEMHLRPKKNVLSFKPLTRVVFKMENAVVWKYISLQIVIKGLCDQLTVRLLPSAALSRTLALESLVLHLTGEGQIFFYGHYF